ncbi:MAG: HDOD domain-containing protein [Myxococcota bacterium]
MTEPANTVTPETFYRALFVDDEIDVLRGLERMLFEFDDTFELEFAASGVKALDLMATQEFDVIVTDMRMPEMSGVTLLERVAEKHPRTMRVVLSGHTEIEEAIKSVTVAHQFLSKPASPESIQNVLDRAIELRRIIENPGLRGTITRLKSLPSRPKLYHQLVQLLEHEEGSLSDAAKLIEQDVAISSKVLQVANSGYFSRGLRIESVAMAVPRLGGQVLKSIVLESELAEPLKKQIGGAVDAISAHGLEVGSVCRQLAEGDSSKELAFTAGLLHDVSELISLATEPEQPFVFATHHDDDGRRDSGEVGAFLLSLWGISLPVVEAIAFQSRPGQICSGFNLAAHVHVTSRVCVEPGDIATIVRRFPTVAAYRDLLEHAVHVRDQMRGSI